MESVSVNFGTNTSFSMSELYEVSLSTPVTVDIGSRHFDAGEVIAEFSRIVLSTETERKIHTAARGGYDNRVWVNWDETQEVIFNFTQGIFSTSQLALLSNSNLLEYSQELSKPIPVRAREVVESDENGCLGLEHDYIAGSLFVYDESTGSKLSYTSVDSKTVSIARPYVTTICRYEWEYTNGAGVVQLGRRLIPGYLQVEGKTKLKDDSTGRVVTGLLKMPRVKLLSDLSIQLGRQASPNVAAFQCAAYPVGPRGDKKVFDIYMLNDDLSADM